MLSAAHMRAHFTLAPLTAPASIGSRSRTGARIVALLAAALAASPTIAAAQSKTTTVSLDYEQLKEKVKEDLREELKEELKAEIKAEVQQEGAATEAPKTDTWAEEEWKWEEPVKPELNFLEIDGYFRFRYELFKHLDLGSTYVNGNTGGISGPFTPPGVTGVNPALPVNPSTPVAPGMRISPPTPLCNLDQGPRQIGMTPTSVGYRPPANTCANNLGHTDTLAGANMRLRLEPVLNVYEDIKVKMQVDVLDNVVLGSNPDAFIGGGLHNPYVPISFLSRTQLPPSDGVNALEDSIRVKRAWAEVGTPLGQLRVGRMPNNFGAGILYNEGKGLDSNYGDTVDRIMFSTKISDFLIAPAFDWVASGPNSSTRLLPQAQPFNRDQRMGVDEYVVSILRKDKDREIKEKLENDELVLNYGTYQSYRVQSLDQASFYAMGDPNQNSETKPSIIRRDARAWIYSVWFKLLWRKLTLEGEYAGVVGKITNSALSGNYADYGGPVTLFQQGAVVTADYRFLRDALTLSFLFAVASGDPSGGWGLTPLAPVTGNPGDWDGSQAANKGRVTNYRFNPDYYVDYIFWRQLVGQVTDATVFRPGIQYNLTEGFGARLDLVYSRALFSSSTPSASIPGQASKNLGLEGDLKVFYNSEDGFHAWLVYGLFIPFSGLNRNVLNDMGQTTEVDAGVAQTIQAMLAVTF